ncbi:hypothetical protein HBI56_241240 [Parastagonospora nodorum]|uniref:Secreted LysM effector LysM C-terminal domain-containing protein n=1 Tax=Phaeosphaeria nodorum (strain SN15 / ATCC MYA-4574 / FGSC 10173) TaxID=321614 RepID=A0A7U2I028_PHANO|nr:hypothetical protein HBH56_243420 [Parastagonospora nodorum]QRC97003.1 hypothetical protein JI435_308020 [Parastagonospora nodorum SN15]KAH3924145.1 hypothetical protein HBH54_198880 [Parastagonospora nodorum]KAH3944693.1 hypothetical protein HBH53_155390 [Parastagonospora nodorum]KAH3964774.1 hypothetical protein HBH52_210350 [Parastagonospora nodorum]
MHASKSILWAFAVLTLQLPTTTADPYDLTIYQSHFCDAGLSPESYYSFEGDDVECHGFGLPDDNCRFYYDGGFENDDCQNNGQPAYGTSIAFRDEGGGRGCQFWADQYCSVDRYPEALGEVDQFNGCFDFQTEGRIGSFKCNV